MTYNNGFPIGYQPIYSQYQTYPQYQQTINPQQPTTQSSNVGNGMIWVQGIGGAKSYLIAPNATVTLWDSEAPVIYLKSADASGMPSMKILDYKIREEQQNDTPPVQNNDVAYATKEDIEALRAEMDTFKNKINAISNKKEQRRDYKNG